MGSACVSDFTQWQICFFFLLSSFSLSRFTPWWAYFLSALCVCKEGEGGDGRRESSGGSDVCVAGLDGQGGERDVLSLSLPGRGPAPTTQ